MQREKSYTVAQYAELKGVNKGTVYRWIDRGEVFARKVAGKLRIFEKEQQDARNEDDSMASIVHTLEEQLRIKDEQISELLSKVDQQNAIIMQQARSLDSTRMLLEYQRKPFWRRWFSGGSGTQGEE